MRELPGENELHRSADAEFGGRALRTHGSRAAVELDACVLAGSIDAQPGTAGARRKEQAGRGQACCPLSTSFTRRY